MNIVGTLLLYLWFYVACCVVTGMLHVFVLLVKLSSCNFSGGMAFLAVLEIHIPAELQLVRNCIQLAS